MGKKSGKADRNTKKNKHHKGRNKKDETDRNGKKTGPVDPAKVEKLRKKARKCCRSTPRCKGCPVTKLLVLRKREKAARAA